MSEHFKREEFACPHCGAVKVDVRLMQVLECIRRKAGGHPLRLRSGYRCPIHNREVGGVRHSQHLYGRAADIPAGFATPRQAAECGATGIGIAGAWAVHVDVRGGSVVTWHYG